MPIPSYASSSRIRCMSTLLLLAAVALAAQTGRPNFTGEWVAEKDASQVISVRHTAETLTQSHPSESGHHAIVFRMDGKPTEIRFGEGEHAMVFVARARWEGTSLVL
jgi:hypothetical protein